MDSATQSNGIGEPNEGARQMHATRELSRAIERLYKEHFGRGPESAYSHFVGPDTVMTVLVNTLTPVERTLVALGEQQRLRDIRTMFQHATEDKFRAAAERATGRKVIAFMSGIDVNHDTSCEVFTLAPELP
jgi:uncharacterized protein YbcI